MARATTIRVTLTPNELREARERVRSGEYRSLDELFRLGLRALLRTNGRTNGSRRSFARADRLAAGYAATAAFDRRISREWEAIPDAWPEK
jgi:Arc/MetJ-type ribon-helix-helix transcriptional regulator